jgi:hypothetical protein
MIKKIGLTVLAVLVALFLEYFILAQGSLALSLASKSEIHPLTAELVMLIYLMLGVMAAILLCTWLFKIWKPRVKPCA